ncbi:aminodeoxychorismate synthase, component I [Streptomyces sp. ERV7]|uniref:aminodeoxychorismate synthase component I n=1 Tax=Streptomyces sp. ERV7 TaxID=1322334 RepID=UPI0007F52F50|nr:aminodeoxychorismate synthase component I [Streptomyces sp. ERV7]OAR23651.1 aminodeoxychorismate synthase, component I [Streptomyces sp. ERV7]
MKKAVRTLLVDNYDSFTFNLYHSLARAGGAEPVVVRNDDPGWDSARLSEFDNVVLSPGPGHPGRAADFGICREIVERTEIPLLGICLGHQGTALLHGAVVERAPEPRHGRTSPVRHTGEDLFRGVPSPFEAVRYHSLTVTSLPEEMEAVAWTADGVLMGHRHRHRPLWGLQFHPESILTEFGDELLLNFTELTREWHRAHGTGAVRSTLPRPVKTLGAAAEPDEAAPRKLRVLEARLPTRWSDEVAFHRLFGRSANAFWLDSSRPDADAGRFSVLGDAAGPLARVARADAHDGTVTLECAAGRRTITADFLDWLDRDLKAVHVELPDLPFDFALGWVGYLGYELKAQCGGESAHRSEDPDAALVFADRAVVLDHLTGLTHLLALTEEGDEDAAHAWLGATARALESAAGEELGEPAAPAAPSAIRLRHERDAYLRLIDACRQEIAAGETYEVCLTNQAEAAFDGDPWEAYRLLRRVSPAPYGALLRFGRLGVLSTSPERFLRVEADGTATSQPIKGTRPRGATPEQDAALVAQLRSDEKDRAENLMIVDLVRNDLGRNAEIGSVEVPRLFDVETYATVHQLVSTVRARLRPDRSAVDCVRAAFPAGSMTGAPKIRTMRLIDALEAGPRGVFSGAIGYFSLSGAADLSVAIRTAVLTPGRVRYGVGGAIVALSDPEAEFEETAVKSAPLLALTGAAFPGRRS